VNEMFLTEYIGRFVEFFAARLMRLAETLRGTPVVRNEVSSADERMAPADWLERTSNIPSELWIDFSGEPGSENSDLSFEGRALRKEYSDSHQRYRAPLRTEEKRRRDTRHPDQQRESRSEQTSRFLDRLNSDAGEQSQENSGWPLKAEPRSSEEKERISKTKILGFKLFYPPPTAAKSKRTLRKSGAVEVPGPVISPRPDREPTRRSHPSSRFKVSESVREKPLPKERVANLSNQLKSNDRVFSRKRSANEGQSATSKIETSQIFEPRPSPLLKIIATSPTPKTSVASRSFDSVSEMIEIEPELFAKEDPKNNAVGGREVLAETRWIDLPDDFLPRSFEAGESSRSLTEHLLLLEREQAGNI
jgi:hypothetical protein